MFIIAVGKISQGGPVAAQGMIVLCTVSGGGGGGGNS